MELYLDGSLYREETPGYDVCCGNHVWQIDLTALEEGQHVVMARITKGRRGQLDSDEVTFTYTRV